MVLERDVWCEPAFHPARLHWWRCLICGNRLLVGPNPDKPPGSPERRSGSASHRETPR